MTILVMYLGFKSLVWLFACIHYVNIVLFHWVYFILLFGYFIEQNICFFHSEAATGTCLQLY